ncbi:MAG: aminoglycoside phosphotransferase family protein [Gemmatimonadota bacterium]|nr:aminoglycoside phosphotransferase family protein [Gemmatimonadota bacterium]
MTPAGLAGILTAFGVESLGAPEPVGGGHINAAWRITGTRPDLAGRFLLQRLNPAVFPDATAVLENCVQVSAHLRNAACAAGWPEARWRVAEPLRTPEGRLGVPDEAGAWWRLFPWLEGTRAIREAGSAAEVHAVGSAFGRFHALMASYDGPPLRSPLPGFHDTPARLRRFEAALAAADPDRSRAAAAEVAFALEHQRWAGALAGAGLPETIAHNDAKAANVLLDASSGAGVAVVDLDTVMPGLRLHDVGDLLRSGVGTVAEDAPATEPVAVDRDRFRVLVAGFTAGLGAAALTAAERELFVTAGVVLCYEQGLRFLGDYLEGDRYYRTSRAGQNLDRARVQLRLAAALAAAQGELELLVR